MRRIYRHPLIRGLWPGLLFFQAALLLAQPPGAPRPAPPSQPGVISVRDVCAAALPRAGQGRELAWSPDGQRIAYFQSAPEGFDLHMQLDVVNADGSGHKVLLTASLLDHLFPAKPTGHQGQLIPPPQSSVGFQWAPDGRGLLLYSDLHIFWLDATTQQTRGIVTGEEPLSDIQLSPDGRNAAFVRRHNLWVVSVAGGPPRQITKHGDQALLQAELDWVYPAELGARHGYAWSPDSTRIAYYEFNLKDVASYTPPFQLAEDRVPPTIDYPVAGGKNPLVQVFIAQVGNEKAAIHIETGADKDVYLPRLQWLPDARHLAIQRLNRQQTRLDLLLADASTGTSRVLLSETDRYWINLSDILYFLKDSPQFLWSSERSGFRHLYLYGLDGKLVRQLTSGDWEVTSLDAVNEKEKKIYFTSTARTPLERQLYIAGFDGQQARWVPADSGTHEAAFAPDGSSYVDRFSTATRPWIRTVYKLQEQPNGRPAAKLFAIDAPPPELKTGRLSRPVNFLTVTTHDAVKLNAMLIQPAAFSIDKKYPAVIYVAGAPGQQAVQDIWKGDVSLWQELLVQHGYVVFAIDNRGTRGRGHLFEEYLHYRFASQETSDLKDGLTFLRSLPYIDPARNAIWGRGFGGMLVVNSMLHPQLQFKAGFAVAPIVDWFHYDAAFTERYLGDPVSNQDGYLSSSPLDNAHSLRNQLLVSQGTADLEVHPEQAMELQHELVEAKKYAEIALYPGQTHTLDGPDACVVSYQRATDLFATALQPPESSPGTKPPPKDGVPEKKQP